MSLFENPGSLILLTIGIILAAAAAGTYIWFAAIPIFRMWISYMFEKWWVNLAAPLVLLLSASLWAAFWFWAFNTVYVEAQRYIPDLTIISDLQDLGNRAKSSFEGTMPDSADSGQAPTQQDTSSPGQEPGGGGGTQVQPHGSSRGCPSGYCAGGNCPPGCANQGSRGYVCRGPGWEYSMAEWQNAPTCR